MTAVEGRWRARADTGLPCHRDHDGRPGRFDESARRLNHPEHEVARRLVAEGHSVVAVAELPGQGRQADLRVCGTEVEVKSWLHLGAGRDRAPTPKSVVNKLLQARGQAATVVLNGHGSGLSPTVARIGVADYGTRSRDRQVRTVRVLGDGFDLTWTRDRALAPDRTPTRSPASRTQPDLGLAL